MSYLKSLARRFLQETEHRDRLAAYDELCAPDYLEHDPGMPRETVGLAEARQTYQELLVAFELRHTPESLIAEGDLVAARFTVRGRHVGEYQGLPPSGRTFEVTGQATLRFEEADGSKASGDPDEGGGWRIAEAWFHWDMQGVLEQLRPPAPTP